MKIELVIKLNEDMNKLYELFRRRFRLFHFQNLATSFVYNKSYGIFRLPLSLKVLHPENLNIQTIKLESEL